MSELHMELIQTCYAYPYAYQLEKLHINCTFIAYQLEKLKRLCSTLESNEFKPLCYSYYKYIIGHLDKLGAPMFWIGIYVAAASLICSLSMAIDVLRGFRHRKLWFPCKFFTLNATSLTLLAIAMKLPLDLSTSMLSSWEQLAKLTSIVFMCAVMGNFMPSLGPMGNKELLTNIIALAILVITVAVNVFIQLYTGPISDFRISHAVVTSSMLVLLVIISFSALTIPISKQVLELKYREKHKMASSEELEQIEKLKEIVKKYWMMAESGGPQFVMASSVTCSASGAICYLTIFILVSRWCKMCFRVVGPLQYQGNLYLLGSSDYKWSTTLILLIQSIGVVMGTIAPVLRWFRAISFKSSKKGIKSYRKVFKVENYWIQMLVQWKESLLDLRHRKCRKLVHKTKNLILDICIRVQVMIVVASKTVRLFPIFYILIMNTCYSCCKKFFPDPTTSGNHVGPESGPSTEVDFSSYVLQLDGDEEIPERILKDISNSANQLIQGAKKQQPKYLMELLHKYAGSKGVAEFDNGPVPHLHSSDAPNCWGLSLLTVTSIAIALPNIKNDIVDRLLRSVGEGFLYVRIIEKSLDTKGDLADMRNAADVVWSGVELYRKWLDEDLQNIALKGKGFSENLQMIGDIAKKKATDFKRKMSEDSEENPLNWPVKVIAANSMYTISQRILMDYEGSSDQTYEKLFRQLSVIIADILRDCLTNLPRVITMKCYCSVIEKREESVQQAARLLGETEEILKILQQHKLPTLDLDPTADSGELHITVESNNIFV